MARIELDLAHAYKANPQRDEDYALLPLKMTFEDGGAYPRLAQLWWQNVAEAVTGEKTPQQAMDNLAEQMDQVMARLERAGMERCAPKLNPKGDPNKHLSDKAAPWKKLDNEKPKGETIAYDQLLNAWKNGKVR